MNLAIIYARLNAANDELKSLKRNTTRKALNRKSTLYRKRKRLCISAEEIFKMKTHYSKLRHKALHELLELQIQEFNRD